MEPVRVRVFFYGSFINRDVLKKGGFTAGRVEVARAWGFGIRIETLATLVRSDRHCVYGILCDATHAELDGLYDQGWLGRTYLPEAIVVERQNGGVVPALCYIAHTSPPARPAADYLDWILTAARELQFPAWYIDRLEGAGAD